MVSLSHCNLKVSCLPLFSSYLFVFINICVFENYPAFESQLIQETSVYICFFIMVREFTFKENLTPALLPIRYLPISTEFSRFCRGQKPGISRFHESGDWNPITASIGGAEFYLKEPLVYIERRDIQFSTPDNHENVFIELIFPNKKNIVGCIYHRPSRDLSIEEFNNDIMNPMLEVVSSENKTCALHCH